MVDVSGKKVTRRVALAQARVKLGRRQFQILLRKGSPKGNVFETARIAGIMAAKKTHDIIPLCHPLAIQKVSLEIFPDPNRSEVMISAQVICQGRTGVEMEALTAASVAALTVYDMMKWTGQTMEISARLLHKSGGKSGTYHFIP